MLAPQSCVILVPAGGAIEGGCEEGLRELERRGYPVWRVRGYSAVDAARCQMATDALADGFEELFWIDSDIVFEPNDVEKLRRHRLPFVCGIYAKKGPRQFAANYLPGTESLLFGPNGGVTEILYSGFGFNCTHRSVYEDIQRHCRLPICNEQFPKPLIPYFMPFAHPHGEHGAWYLNEDYAFCERARQAGHRIMVDTTIRLWHVGSYRYSWEDAGSEKQRFPNYNFSIGTAGASKTSASVTPSRVNAPSRDPGTEHDLESLPDRSPQSDHANSSSSETDSEATVKNFLTDPIWKSLLQDYPWPDERPPVPPNRNHGWLNAGSRDLLERALTLETRLVVEVGSWLGKSTRFILEQAPQAAIVAIDHWRGSAEHQMDAQTLRLLPRLYETFQVNCWESRQRLLPLRMPSVDGLRLIAGRGLKPDLIYLDADHSYAGVKADLEACLELFPQSTIVGDDWNWAGVRQAVEEVVQSRQLKLETNGVGWSTNAFA